VRNIAGLCNEGRNVFGLMPHPERCSEEILGGTDGQYIFRSILGRLMRRRRRDGDAAKLGARALA